MLKMLYNMWQKNKYLNGEKLYKLVLVEIHKKVLIVYFLMLSIIFEEIKERKERKGKEEDKGDNDLIWLKLSLFYRISKI